MNPVTFPLTTGQSGSEVSYLQQALLHFISRNIFNVSDKDLINEIRCCEIEKKYFGKATTELTALFCEARGIPIPQHVVVDEAVANAINQLLQEQPPEQTVSGIIRYASGPAYLNAEGVNVAIYKMAFRGRMLLGNTTVKAGGIFIFAYTGEGTGTGQGNVPGLRAEVSINGTPFRSEVVYSYSDHTELEIIIDEESYQPLSEFSSVQNALGSLLGEVSPVDINIQDETEISQLAKATNEPEWIIITFVKASRMAALTTIPAAFFYGLFRQGLPDEAELLLHQPLPVLSQALAVSVVNNIVSLDDENIAEYLSKFYAELILLLTDDAADQEPIESATYFIIDYILNQPEKTQAFLKLYFDFLSASNGDDFWQYLVQQDTFYQDYVSRLQAALSVAVLSNSNAAVNSRLMAVLSGSPMDGDPALPEAGADDPRPDLLTSYKVNDWYTIITNARLNDPNRFFFPSDIIGDTDEQRSQEFASRIYRNFATAYPIASVNVQVVSDAETPFIYLKSDLSTFRDNNPSFDFRTTSIIALQQEGSFNFEGVSKEPFIHEVATMQRLMVLTTDYPTVSAFANDGLISSMHISRQELSDFVDRYTETVGSVRNAMSMHAAASSIVTYNMAKAFNLVPLELFQFDTINSNIPVTDAAQPGMIQPLATPSALDLYAEWRTLFGALDSCNCTDCQSVFSPSAYLVDLLQFIRSNLSAVYNELVNRRPDIINIELSCPNTNTVVPHIDIVNELLEDLVSKGFYENGAYKMFARQTKTAAALQRVTPEYINSNGVTVSMQTPGGGAPVTETVLSPYPVLQSALYPQSLPYNFFKRQMDVHLDLVGVRPFEVSQRYSEQEILDAWTDVGYCTEYLGISKEEYTVITNTTPAPEDYMKAYGFTLNGGVVDPIPDPAIRGNFISVSNTPGTADYWQAVLVERVDIFLQQTGVTYKELLQLLDCFTLNPWTGPTSRKMAILKNDPAVADDTCELKKLKIEGMDALVISRLYRFVRMQKALGWTFYELDKALMALGAAPDNINSWNLTPDTFTGLARISYVATTLQASVEETSAIWKPIDVLPYSDYSRSEPEAIPSQYSRIFRNPALADLQASDYPFPETPATTSVAVETLVNYLSGIFQLDGAGLTGLLAGIFPGQTAIIPNLANLSLVYREAVLLKGMRMTTEEWSFYKLFVTDAQYYGYIYYPPTSPYQTQPDPFNDTYDAVRFITVVKPVKNTGIPTSVMDYLLRDKPADKASDDKHTIRLNTILTDLRAGLKKIYYPDYSPQDITADSGSRQLEVMLQLVLDEAQASRLTGIVQQVEDPGGPSYSATDLDFINNDLHFVIPVGGADKLANPAAPGYLANIDDRRVFVFNCLKAYLVTTVLEPFLVSFLASALGIASEILQLILPTELDTVSNLRYYGVLLDQAFVQNTDDLDRWDTTLFRNQYRALLVLEKVGILITLFGFEALDAHYLWGAFRFNDIVIGAFSLPFPVREAVDDIPLPPKVIGYSYWFDFLCWMRIRAFTGKEMELIYNFVYNNQYGSGFTKSEMLKIIAAAFKMPVADISVLLDKDVPPNTGKGIFNIDFLGNDFTYPLAYLRIIDCLEAQYLLPAPMETLYTIAVGIRKASRANLSIGSVSQDDANEVIQVVKAQYNDAEWPDVIRPINDRLRKERRDALLAYLLVHPPADYKYQWYTINDIYDTLMLDVEMNPCMPTTRVLLATNTIQLWVDRVQLGLEKYFNSSLGQWQLLQLTNAQSRQWENWRRLYRVWEANRKIFIYPENWIEPELRDGKSPLFRDLEKFLDQNDLTAENVEDAYRTYLDRLDEIAHLEVVGIYRESTKDYSENPFPIAFNYPNNDVVHVFGRTPAKPHIYYYRKRVLNEWSPWEKMDVQIDGDHFVPVMWRGRLRFYWLVFTQDQPTGGTATAMRSDDKYTMPEPTRWKIELAWTELKNRDWTPKQVSKEALYSFTIYEEDPMNLDHIAWFSYAHNGVQRDWYFKGALENQKKNIQFYSRIDEDGNLQFEVIERIVRNSGPYLNHLFNLNTLPFKTWAMTDKMADALAMIAADEPTYRDVFSSQRGYFTVRFNSVTATIKAGPTDFNYSFFFDLYHSHPYEMAGYGFRYNKPTAIGYTHYPDGGGLKLLDRAPDQDTGKKEGKYIVLPKNLPYLYPSGSWGGSPLVDTPYFFYQDFDHSFFVEKVMVTITVQNIFGPGYFTLTNTLPVVSVSNGILSPVVGSNVVGISSLKYPVFIQIKVPRYRFHCFTHDKVDRLKDLLHRFGTDGLLNRVNITPLADDIFFNNTYLPTVNVDTRYPHNNIDLTYESAYALYNWELFFHIPMLIANKLSQNQKFEEARRWYHYVFNPTNRGNASAAIFWNFTEFYNHATTAATASPQSIMADPNLQLAIDNWANNPFKPHLVARTRISAYMKNTVMKYLDNLIAWGDMLFRTDSREAINEATLHYVLAAQLLGSRPATIPARARHAVKTYKSLSAANLNAFSNALVQIESLLLPSGATTVGSVNNTPNPLATGSMFYFCFVPNSKLASYWDIISDRLFKIRNCQSIDGVERELALFAPPIDPALLVKAAAAGISLADAIGDINAPLPLYRFQVISQKATELVQDVKMLGSMLLAALEKRDVERLALLRSGQELKVLEVATQVREQQAEEAGKQIEALQQQQLMATQRRDFYQLLIDKDLNIQEIAQLDLMQANIPLQVAQGATQALSSLLFAVPDATLGIFSTGITLGGSNLGSVVSAASSVTGTIVNVNSTKSSMAAIKAGYLRRKEDWQQQLKLANTELQQVDRQLIAAQIRKAIADQELKNHALLIANAQEMDEAMRSKYTNEELYNWISGQIAFTYFQSYKLAYDMAKRSERCYQNELSIATSGFIQFGYWDSLKKGLLSGEQLSYDLKRMEASYLTENKRTLELTKDISLAAFYPDALLALKTGQSKSAEIKLEEWMFDLDYPGQHLRRIKSVSVSIPCVAGPYTTVSCKLSLLDSKYRKSPNLPYAESADNFTYTFGNIQSIATSKAQNDSGMFELNFRDERYLPFEWAGAISRWRIELPAAYAQFDYSSISDVILHINYTAKDNGALKAEAVKELDKLFFDIGTAPVQQLTLNRLFSLKHEFSNEWYAGFNSSIELPVGYGGGLARPIDVTLRRSMFPLYATGKTITVTGISFALKPYSDGPSYKGMYWQIGGSGGLKPFDLNSPSYTSSVAVADGELVIPAAADSADLRLSISKINNGNTLFDEQELSDWYMIVEYQLS